tara:strand:+ start:291 stop:494 length:204 start_codon:yes stop_codon:yes gene_type:complete
MTLSPNDMTPYIRKIQQKFDEAQAFLVKNGFHQATKGLLQDIENANGIDKKNKLIHATLWNRKQQSL